MMNAFDPYDPYGTSLGYQSATGYAQPGGAVAGVPELGYTPAPYGVSQWGPRQWGVSQWGGPQQWVVRQPQTWIMRQPQFYVAADQDPYGMAQAYEAPAMATADLAYKPAPYGVSQWGVSQWGPRQYGVSQWSGPQQWIVRQPQTWIVRQPQWYINPAQDVFSTAQPFDVSPAEAAELAYKPAPYGVSQWGVSQWGPRQYGVSQWSGPQQWIVRQPQTWIVRQPQWYINPAQDVFSTAQPFDVSPAEAAELAYKPAPSGVSQWGVSQWGPRQYGVSQWSGPQQWIVRQPQTWIVKQPQWSYDGGQVFGALR